MSDPSGLDQGIARLNKIGGPAFVTRMIDLFLGEVPDRLNSARIAERAGDLGAISAAAHSIKSSAWNFGADQLALTAEKIEVLTRSNSSENLRNLLDELDKAYEATKARLETQKESFKT